jgi:hypothetical protein
MMLVPASGFSDHVRRPSCISELVMVLGPMSRLAIDVS